MQDKSAIVETLHRYFVSVESVSFAFLFGSAAQGRQTEDSDIDIAVYFNPRQDEIDIESDSIDENEDAIWDEIEKLTGSSVDLVVLNRAPATLVHTVFDKGIPIIIKDHKLYRRVYLAASRISEDFREFIKDYWAIKQRSSSMSEDDKERLIKILDFLETEINDYTHFAGLNKKRYLTDSDFRRNVERFIENIVNASIDIAKILLASEKIKVPQTYKETLTNLSLLAGFSSATAEKLSSYARLRNILAHEYLDLRFIKIKDFIETSEPLYRELIDFSKQFVEGN